MTNAKGPDLVKLFLERRDGVLGYVLALTRDRAAAEEIFQEIGLAVVEEAGKGSAVERFVPWVHEIARRRVAEHFRKTARRREVARLESLDEVVGQAFEENACSAEERGRRHDTLGECLDELPATQREMIERRYRQEATIPQIARSMDWSEGAVKVALWKARRRLEGCVESRMEEAE